MFKCAMAVCERMKRRASQNPESTTLHCWLPKKPSAQQLPKRDLLSANSASWLRLLVLCYARTYTTNTFIRPNSVHTHY